MKYQNQNPDDLPVITRLSTVTALGDTLDSLWQGVLNGQSAIRPIYRFQTENYSTSVAACIEDLTTDSGTSLIHPLLDRLLAEFGPVPADAHLITATTKAGIDNLELIQKGQPADADAVLPALFPAFVSDRLHLDNDGLNINSACASSTIAVARAAGLIASGKTDAVLVCCLDLTTEFIFSGFSALKALSPEPCKPFDRNRRGLSLGEGAAAILLMSSKRADIENHKPLGKICGWGMANDATHITAPAKDASGLIQAISRAIHMADMCADDISAISAHGTGTVYNDLMELTAFKTVFANRKIPIYSIKGAIGHTLGAAGGIEVALGLRSLGEQVAPPTVGLTDPMKGVEQLASSDPVPLSGQTMLSTNSGFGGTNAALILSR